MKDVPSWLKSLRLHKYAALFSQMTYEEMMTLTEHHLESQNVTKGARHKIALSIQKLRERQSVLRALEKVAPWWPAGPRGWHWVALGFLGSLRDGTGWLSGPQGWPGLLRGGTGWPSGPQGWHGVPGHGTGVAFKSPGVAQVPWVALGSLKVALGGPGVTPGGVSRVPWVPRRGTGLLRSPGVAI
ncbi:PREDICTED: protein Smaug homolog 2, partial [Calidris pugnax]|uniref:protein Smaug homolog 2 n=1 Tax=Calidris pugnax TaxID=198806 RepID=UPI00071D1ED7